MKDELMNKFRFLSAKGGKHFGTGIPKSRMPELVFAFRAEGLTDKQAARALGHGFANGVYVPHYKKFGGYIPWLQTANGVKEGFMKFDGPYLAVADNSVGYRFLKGKKVIRREWVCDVPARDRNDSDDQWSHTVFELQAAARREEEGLCVVESGSSGATTILYSPKGSRRWILEHYAPIINNEVYKGLYFQTAENY